MARLVLSLSAAALVLASACDHPEAPCASDFGRTEASLAGDPRPRPGGWDANGRPLDGLRAGVGLSGVAVELVLDTGRIPLSFDRGRLVPTAGGQLDLGGHELWVTGGAGQPQLLQVRAVAPRDDGAVELELWWLDEPVCAQGERGVFVEGRWDETGARTPGGLTFACASGALHKCVSRGLAPWRVGADVHQACTRAVRADYCGDGRAYTRDGTPIDVFARVEDQAPREGASLEAAWGPEGATCLDHLRFDVVDTRGQPITPPCASAFPRCEGEIRGGLLANASVPQALVACN